jgi:endogenous inhibitor of DNA gyrase (YacG/DUF329 family)
MADSQMINKCGNCGQDYCMECSGAATYDKFCSQRCEDEFNEESNK